MNSLCAVDLHQSLRNIEACLQAQAFKRYHKGLRVNIARSTLANANGMRDWCIYGNFAQSLFQPV